MATTKALGNMTTSTESTDNISPLLGNSESSVGVVLARVIKGGAITDQDSKFYKDVSTLRGVQFETLPDENNGRVESGIAQSLFPHITNPPLEGEIILIITNKSNRGNFDYFYISSVNLYNTCTYNPDVPVFELDENDNIPLGKGLSESNLDKIRKLLLAPGDISLEGRFGNSIKLGNSNTLNIFDDINIKTPYEGNENSPIIIIRNGQKSIDSLNPLFEDINEDNSSVYLTKEQVIPINVISNNLQTFGIESKQTETSDDIVSFDLGPSDINDINPPIIDDTPQPDEGSEYREGDHDYLEEPPEITEDVGSGQAFVKEGSSEQISSEPTSDPTFT